jgi:hypothetical protein
MEAKLNLKKLRKQVRPVNRKVVPLVQINNTMATNNVGKVLDDLICYDENVLELLKEFRTKFVDPTTGEMVKISFAEALELIQVLWNKIKETSQECTGKPIQVEIGGEGIAPFILKTLLKALGLEL